jgi:hypothetical protein
MRRLRRGSDLACTNLKRGETTSTYSVPWLAAMLVAAPVYRAEPRNAQNAVLRVARGQLATLPEAGHNSQGSACRAPHAPRKVPTVDFRIKFLRALPPRPHQTATPDRIADTEPAFDFQQLTMVPTHLVRQTARGWIFIPPAGWSVHLRDSNFRLLGLIPQAGSDISERRDKVLLCRFFIF